MLSAFWAKLLEKIAWKFISKYLNQGWIWLKSFFSMKKEVKKYEEKINDPQASAEDIKKAGKDFISN